MHTHEPLCRLQNIPLSLTDELLATVSLRPEALLIERLEGLICTHGDTKIKDWRAGKRGDGLLHMLVQRKRGRYT